MFANPYMSIWRRVEPRKPTLPRRKAAAPRELMLLLSKALWQIEFKHYEEPKLLTVGERV